MKIADFGVARVQMPSGVMTAETGTYRWMAPEVHSEYLWILTCFFVVIHVKHNSGILTRVSPGSNPSHLKRTNLTSGEEEDLFFSFSLYFQVAMVGPKSV